MHHARRALSFDQLYERLRALPPGVDGEILNGELLMSPRPRVRHANAGIGLGSAVRHRYHGRIPRPGRPGGWWILAEPELILGESVVSPDLAGWRRTTLPELPDDTAIRTPPDWVCEILSPSSARYDRVEKARVYADAGVHWRWLVDPAARTLEVYRREGEFWVLVGTWGGVARVRAEPFDAVALSMREWWDGMPPVKPDGP